jgi:ribosomal protein S18 acetylase RimI-like enzyme
MQIKLRQYRSTDSDSVKKLFEDFVEYHSRIDSGFKKIDSHGECFIEYIESFKNSNKKYCIVAVVNELVVGYCVSIVERKPAVYLTPTFGYIDNLCVSNDFQKKGIGTLLLKDALERFKSEGITRTECSVALGNPKSTRFWRKMNFVPFMEQMYLSIDK